MYLCLSIFLNSQLFTTAVREVGPIAFNTATGNAVCEWLRPLCEALVAAECAAEAQLTDRCWRVRTVQPVYAVALCCSVSIGGAPKIICFYELLLFLL